MISSLKARLQLLIGSNAGNLYLPPGFNGSLWFLKFHVSRNSSSWVTVFATKQLKVMLLKAFASISSGPDRVMWIPEPTKGDKKKASVLIFKRMLLRTRVLNKYQFFPATISNVHHRHKTLENERNGPLALPPFKFQRQLYMQGVYDCYSWKGD